MDNNSITIRSNFWKTVGGLNSDITTHLINPSFMSGMPKWPSLHQSFLRIDLQNGNTIVASDGLSEPFEGAESDGQGFEHEFFAESDEKMEDVKQSYLFDIVYQISQFSASKGSLKSTIEKYGVVTTEIYDVRVPDSFKNQDGRVGVILGLQSDIIPNEIEINGVTVKLISVKLLTRTELEYVIQNGAAGREKLR